MDCPLPFNDNLLVQLSHGGGGKMSQKLIDDVFYPAFSNPLLNQHHDGAVFNSEYSRFAYTTDSYVVDPIFFPGGNIGDLAINGTVNDLTSCGAVPMFLSSAFIIEEGFPIEDLKLIVKSMKIAAEKAGVTIVTGDTKVVGKGKCDKVYINTSGIGFVRENRKIHPDRIEVGDSIIITGDIGDHGICILSTRESLGFESDLKSDSASLNKMIETLMNNIDVHAMRDPTRGGVSSTLNEIAQSVKLKIELDETRLPIKKSVASACDILGLDPLMIANEGKMLIFIKDSDKEEALSILKNFEEGINSTIIGKVCGYDEKGLVLINTYLGTKRVLEMINGEQLPRIC